LSVFVYDPKFKLKLKKKKKIFISSNIVRARSHTTTSRVSGRNQFKYRWLSSKDFEWKRTDDRLFDCICLNAVGLHGVLLSGSSKMDCLNTKYSIEPCIINKSVFKYSILFLWINTYLFQKQNKKHFNISSFLWHRIV
jgi:hypothetical protein